MIAYTLSLLFIITLILLGAPTICICMPYFNFGYLFTLLIWCILVAHGG